ncbi:MAG: tyrosine-type recombinase/integrase [Gaiellaceae bacterium]
MLPMQTDDRSPRRLRAGRGNRARSTDGPELQNGDLRGRLRWQALVGGIRNARTARAHVEAPNERGTEGGVERPSFSELGEEWLAAQTHLRSRTHDLYRTALRRHLAPRIGATPIAEVDEDAIAAVIAELQEQGLSGWTIRGILVPLGGVLNYAVRRRLIPDNPIRRLERRERPCVVRREMRILQPNEIDALLLAATPPYRPLLATAIFTGARQSELLGLQWADIDFDGGVVHVRRQLDRSGGYTQPKTPKALREIVLMPSLAALLRQHRFGSPYSAAADPVFATTTGRPMYYRNVTRRGLVAAITKAGLAREGEPRLRFHDLRHTFASLLIAQGLNVVFISRQLGHASPSMTLDVYGGLFDRAEHARRAVEGLEAAFSAMIA